jgi:hypothetical protein
MDGLPQCRRVSVSSESRNPSTMTTMFLPENNTDRTDLVFRTWMGQACVSRLRFDLTQGSASIGQALQGKRWMSAPGSSSTGASPNRKTTTDEEAAFLEEWKKTPKQSALGPLARDFRGFSHRYKAIQIMSYKTLFVLWCLQQGDGIPPRFEEEKEGDQVLVKLFRNGNKDAAVAQGRAETRMKAEAEAARVALSSLAGKEAQVGHVSPPRFSDCLPKGRMLKRVLPQNSEDVTSRKSPAQSSSRKTPAKSASR